ncbi:MAG: Hsp70 family protein [Thermodesulfobacteriota bacterium]|nr:Hsp70 family protein [Thermodesulfobacteriota bacterium]
MSERIIGIDLGTTNSEVAVVEDGKVTIISDSGQMIIPSFVGLDDSGSVLVGQDAKNQYQAYPERTVKSIKRRMGKDTRVQMGDSSYSPQEISAIILKKLKSMAEAYLGEEIGKAVITVPAYFSDAQRRATREAGEIAGLEVVKMINEPTAAALSYESGHHGGRRIMIYDLGGGTFDVSVVQMEDGVIEVVASHGNNHLGGDDFDHKIVEYIIEHLKNEHKVTEPLSAQAMARIERAAENAKKVLSDHPFASISEEYLLENNNVPINLSLDLARHDYEDMIISLIDETLEAVNTALNSADLTVSDIEEVLLVGGSTRTPMVTRRLGEEFGFHPRREVDPDLCVATGAAMQAAMIRGDKVSAVLVDITPYTFGTHALDEIDGMSYPYCFVPIISKNTPIPVTKSEVFYTVYDNQEEVQVGVYQGEHQDAKKNIQIGEFMIKGLSAASAGSEIVTMFELDKDGILHVTSQEKKTGLEKKITIDNAISRFEEAELSEAKEKIINLFGEDEIREEKTPAPKEADTAGPGKQMKVQAGALIEKAERLLGQAEPDDREEMVDLIEKIQEALSANDLTALTESVEELSDIIFYLES